VWVVWSYERGGHEQQKNEERDKKENNMRNNWKR
jgi:hypothetical protein